jgi:hypothetical protein
LENKVRFNATKLLNKHIWNKLGINYKNKYIQPEFQFDFDKVCKALKRVRNFEDFEYEDQRHFIENLINLVADDKLKIDSLTFKKICTLLRPLIPKEKIKYISKKDAKITISFPETEINITNREYNTISKFKENEGVLRAVFGVYDENEKTIKITSDMPTIDDNNNNNTVQNTQDNLLSSNLLLNPYSNGNLSNYLINRSNSTFMPQKSENNFCNLNNTPFISNYNMNFPEMNGLFHNLRNSQNENPLSVMNCNNPQLQQLFMSSFRNFYQNQNNKIPASPFSNMNYTQEMNQMNLMNPMSQMTQMGSVPVNNLNMLNMNMNQSSNCVGANSNINNSNYLLK